MVIEAEPVTPEPEPAGLERELVDRGVSRGVAAELVRDRPEDQIRIQIANLDGKRRKIKDPGAWLASAIRADFAVKAEPQAMPAEAPDERALQAQTRDRAERLRMRRFWEGLSPAEREAFDAEALAHAAPEQRAEYDRQADPRLRRLHLTPIRDAYLRARLAAG